MKALEHRLKSLRAPVYRLLKRRRPVFDCPICGYRGPFMDKRERCYAKCPRCGELERARLQQLVMLHLIGDADLSEKAALHIAPENALRGLLSSRYGTYLSADLLRRDVDRRFDIQSIPFPDASFDLVFASHVLEYPTDDRKAIAEIRRVLKPGGLAVLPVPIMHAGTRDLEERHPVTHLLHEPGLDYTDRYAAVFDSVTVFTSADFDHRHQLHVFEGEAANRHPLSCGGGWRMDHVPVCFVGRGSTADAANTGTVESLMECPVGALRGDI